MQIASLEDSVEGSQNVVETAVRELSQIRVVKDYQMYQRGSRYVILTKIGEQIAYAVISIQEKLKEATDLPDEKEDERVIEEDIQRVKEMFEKGQKYDLKRRTIYLNKNKKET